MCVEQLQGGMAILDRGQLSLGKKIKWLCLQREKQRIHGKCAKETRELLKRSASKRPRTDMLVFNSADPQTTSIHAPADTQGQLWTLSRHVIRKDLESPRLYVSKRI